MRALLEVSLLAILLLPLTANAGYISDYDKFYLRAQGLCTRTLQPMNIEGCDLEMARCMSHLFTCAKDTAVCSYKPHGDGSIACNFAPFTHDGYHGVCDGSSALSDVTWNRDCQDLTGEKYATPGCNNAVVEINELCDDGGFKPDKCADTCQAVNGAVVARSATDFAPLVGAVPFDPGAATGSGPGSGSGLTDPGPLSDDPPPAAVGPDPGTAPGPLAGDPSGTTGSPGTSGTAPQGSQNSGTSASAANNGITQPSAASGAATPVSGGCTLLGGNANINLIWLALFLISPILLRRR